MNKSKLFKGLALLNFTVLLLLFLLYRNGAFDAYFSKPDGNSLTSPNSGVPAKHSNDSIITKKDSIRPSRLSSSKSMVLIEHWPELKDSSTRVKDSVQKKIAEDKKIMMYSSKSGIIMEPGTLDTLRLKFKSSPKKKESKP